MSGDCVLGIDCDKNASASGGQHPFDPLPGLCPGPDAFIICFRQLYPALDPGLINVK